MNAKTIRYLGIPRWFSLSVTDPPTHYIGPQHDLEYLPNFKERCGAAQTIHLVMAMSGIQLCLIRYEGADATHTVAFNTQDFIALWNHRIPEIEQITETNALIYLWLENSFAIRTRHDDNGRVWHLYQRNGFLRTFSPSAAAR